MFEGNVRFPASCGACQDYDRQLLQELPSPLLALIQFAFLRREEKPFFFRFDANRSLSLAHGRDLSKCGGLADASHCSIETGSEEKVAKVRLRQYKASFLVSPRYRVGEQGLGIYRPAYSPKASFFQLVTGTVFVLI